MPIVGPHRADAFLIEGLADSGARYGLTDAAAFEPTRWLDDGDVVRVGRVELEVIHTPGHTPGHVVFFERATGSAIVGDVIFNGSVGRTDCRAAVIRR